MREKRLNKQIKISLLSVMAFILMFFELPIPIFPEFLKIDISDLPALLGSFALGPVEGIMIELFKNILKAIFKGTQTGFVGEVANFVVGAVLVGIAGTVYKQKKSKKAALIGLLVGSIVMSVLAAVLNYTILLPLYAKAFKAPIGAIVGMGSKINHHIHDLKDFVVWSIFPFNLIKGAIVSLVTMPLYKKVSPILHQEDVLETEHRKLPQN